MLFTPTLKASSFNSEIMQRKRCIILYNTSTRSRNAIPTLVESRNFARCHKRWHRACICKNKNHARKWKWPAMPVHYRIEIDGPYYTAYHYMYRLLNILNGVYVIFVLSIRK